MRSSKKANKSLVRATPLSRIEGEVNDRKESVMKLTTVEVLIFN